MDYRDVRVLLVTGFSGLAPLVPSAMPAAPIDAPRPSVTVREYGGLWLVVRPDGMVVR